MRESPFDLLNRHVKISREIFTKLSLYHDLLFQWQSKINLVGKDTLKNAWQRHFLDSLQLTNLIDDPKKNIVDIGSGAGFPGMVLAICGASNVHLIESDTKKTIFLREVARLTKTDVFIHHCRIEDYSYSPVDIIISRACAHLDKLFILSSPMISHETICLFPKGKNYTMELDDAKEHWQFDHAIIPSVTDTQGVILKLTHICRREHDGRNTK